MQFNTTSAAIPMSCRQQTLRCPGYCSVYALRCPPVPEQPRAGVAGANYDRQNCITAIRDPTSPRAGAGRRRDAFESPPYTCFCNAKRGSVPKYTRFYCYSRIPKPGNLLVG